MYHSFLIHSSDDGHLGCFHVLAMINSAVMNIGVHVSLSGLITNSLRNNFHVCWSFKDTWKFVVVVLFYFALF